METGRPNRIDPMKIDEKWRDPFPKMGLDRKYIGDGFPLCADLPSKHFLAKGATYRLLGKSPMPEMHIDPPEWLTDKSVLRLTLEPHPNGQASLFSKLCGANRPEDCRYANLVTLDETLECNGSIECSIDTIRVAEAANGIFYEYLSPPCVFQGFYEAPKMVALRTQRRNVMCADPRTLVASTACCPGGRAINAFWDEKVRPSL